MMRMRKQLATDRATVTVFPAKCGPETMRGGR